MQVMASEIEVPVRVEINVASPAGGVRPGDERSWTDWLDDDLPQPKPQDTMVVQGSSVVSTLNAFMALFDVQTSNNLSHCHLRGLSAGSTECTDL